MTCGNARLFSLASCQCTAPLSLSQAGTHIICRDLSATTAATTTTVFCPPGTSGPECSACPSETFQPEPGQMACLVVTVCSAGQYERTAPTSTSDRHCAACTTAASCGANQYLSGTCGGQSNTACSPCHATCASCFGSSSTECLSCTPSLALHQGSCLSSCPAGRYADSGGICRLCDSTCYTCNAAGSQSCTACSGDLYFNMATRSCGSICPSEHYKLTSTSDNRCVGCKVCPPGFYSGTPCAVAADTVCSACASGMQA